MPETERSHEAHSTSPVVDGTYMLAHPDVIDLVSDSGGVRNFMGRLSEEIEAMYSDGNLESIDRRGFSKGYKTTEVMACRGNDYSAIKQISSDPSLPLAVNGTLTLHRRNQSGTALIANAAFLTAVRTAVTTTLVLGKIKPDPEVLFVIGAGEQGIMHATAAGLLIPGLKRIVFHDKSQATAEDAVERVSALVTEDKKDIQLNRLEVVSSNDLDVAGEADAVVTATYGMDIVLSANQLKEDAVLAAVGADMVGKRELGNDIYQQARFVTDELRQSLREGELQYAAQLLGVSQKDENSATYHGSLLGGRIIGISNLLEATDTFTSRPEPLAVYDSTGFSGQDLAVGRLMIQLLEEQERPKVQFHGPSSVSLLELLGR